MKRGCLLGLLGYGVAVAAYDVLLRRYLDAPVHVFAALGGALFGVVFVGAAIGRWRAGRDARLIRAAEAREAPVDGRLAAVIGTVSPLGLPLRSPIGDLSCVAYEYEISHDSLAHGGRRGRTRMSGRRGNNTSKLFTGVALTPSAISTLHGSVRLLSFPLMEDFEQRRSSDAGARERVRRYIAATRFEPQGFVAAVKGFAGALADDDGQVRFDCRMAKEAELPRDAWFAERVIPVGAMVCAIGRYSAERRALVARGATFTRVLPGDAAAARAQVKSRARTQLGTAAVLLVVTHAFIAIAAFMSGTRYARDTPERQAATVISAIGRGDQEAMALAVQRGANPNAQNSAGEAPVHVATDAETVRTLARLGADVDAFGGAGRTPLMFAAMRHQPEVAQAWLDAGATVNLARPDGATALSDAEESGDQETANVLRAAGGLCDHVNAERGRLVPPAPAIRAGSAAAGAISGGAGAAGPDAASSSSPGADLSDDDPVQAVREYLAAIHAKDQPRLRALTVGRGAGFFEGVDFDVWQATRPRVADGAQGYLNTEAATLTLPVFDAGGQPILWAYQLRRVGGDWKIAREWARPTEAPETTVQPREPLPDDDVERPRQPSSAAAPAVAPPAPPARRP